MWTITIINKCIARWIETLSARSQQYRLCHLSRCQSVRHHEFAKFKFKKMTVIGAWCCVLRKILRILDKHLKKGLKKRIALRWETPTQSYIRDVIVHLPHCYLQVNAPRPSAISNLKVLVQWVIILRICSYITPYLRNGIQASAKVTIGR